MMDLHLFTSETSPLSNINLINNSLKNYISDDIIKTDKEYYFREYVYDSYNNKLYFILSNEENKILTNGSEVIEEISKENSTPIKNIHNIKIVNFDLDEINNNPTLLFLIPPAQNNCMNTESIIQLYKMNDKNFKNSLIRYNYTKYLPKNITDQFTNQANETFYLKLTFTESTIWNVVNYV